MMLQVRHELVDHELLKWWSVELVDSPLEQVSVWPTERAAECV